MGTMGPADSSARTWIVTLSGACCAEDQEGNSRQRAAAGKMHARNFFIGYRELPRAPDEPRLRPRCFQHSQGTRFRRLFATLAARMARRATLPRYLFLHRELVDRSRAQRLSRFQLR